MKLPCQQAANIKSFRLGDAEFVLALSAVDSVGSGSQLGNRKEPGGWNSEDWNDAGDFIDE